jgi:endo-1,4-beta-xylanase
MKNLARLTLIATAALTAAFSAMFTSCKEGEKDNFVPVQKLTHELPTEVDTGTPVTLAATVMPANATNQNIVWSIKYAGSAGATITNNILTATYPGLVRVEARILNGSNPGRDYVLEWDINVKQGFVPVTGITGVPTKTHSHGWSLPLTDAKVEPANATNQRIIWSIKDQGVTDAHIKYDNCLFANIAGTAILTATIADGTAVDTPYSQDFEIEVAPYVPVSQIVGVPLYATIGIPLTLTGTIEPANATNQTIVWSIDHAGTTGATLNGNVLTAPSVGYVRLLATITGGLSDGRGDHKYYTILVEDPNFVEVSEIVDWNHDAIVGIPLTLSATVKPANATNRTIVWSVQDAGSTGATIEGNVLTATSAGVVIILATIVGGKSSGASNYLFAFPIGVDNPTL